MDLTNQQRIKDIAEQRGAENVVLILGSSDAEGAEIYAETVTMGDPTYAGPLAGVSLKLPVYHIFDEKIKSLVDPAIWQEQLGMVELVFDTSALANAVAKMREAHSISEL